MIKSIEQFRARMYRLGFESHSKTRRACQGVIFSEKTQRQASIQSGIHPSNTGRMLRGLRELGHVDKCPICERKMKQ